MRRFKPVPKDKKHKDIPSKYLKVERTKIKEQMRLEEREDYIEWVD